MCLLSCLVWVPVCGGCECLCKILVCLRVCLPFCLSICPSPPRPTARFLVCLLSLALHACPSLHLFFSVPPSLSFRPLPRPLSRLLPRLLSRLPVLDFPFTVSHALPSYLPPSLPPPFPPSFSPFFPPINFGVYERSAPSVESFADDDHTPERAQQISTEYQERASSQTPTIESSHT